MDKFNASDTFYHKLSMVLPMVPRSYNIKMLRTELNTSIKKDIHCVPAPHHGSFEGLRDKIEELVYKPHSFFCFAMHMQ